MAGIFEVECKNCGKKYAVKDSSAGQLVQCKNCGRAFRAVSAPPTPPTIRRPAATGAVLPAVTDQPHSQFPGNINLNVNTAQPVNAPSAVAATSAKVLFFVWTGIMLIAAAFFTIQMVVGFANDAPQKADQIGVAGLLLAMAMCNGSLFAIWLMVTIPIVITWRMCVPR